MSSPSGCPTVVECVRTFVREHWIVMIGRGDNLAHPNRLYDLSIVSKCSVISGSGKSVHGIGYQS